MNERSYIVHLIDGPDPRRLFKHFAQRLDARAFATESVNSQSTARADVYEVSVSGTRQAITALQMGDGRLVESFGRPATESEREQATNLLKNVISEDIFAPDWKPWLLALGPPHRGPSS